MAADLSRREELWRLGLVIEAGTSVPPLQESPLTVLVHPQVSGSALPCQLDAIAICKSSVVDTYDFVNDYGGKGCAVKSTDLEKCRWPHVLVVPSVLASGWLSVEEAETDVQCPEDLQVKAGSTHPISPTLLLTSQQFLTTYGFTSKERVWFHPAAPVPLERVVLAPSAPALSESQAREVVGQLYERSRAQTVIAHRGLDLLLPSREEALAPVRLSVLETTPVLQGRVTERTVVAVLPPEEHSPFPSPKWERRPRSMSTLSASDLSHEYSFSSLLAQPAITQPQDFNIQVVPAPCFKLHSQYIVLPKKTAVQYSIFAGQPVLLSRADPELEGSLEGGGRTISELVIQLAPPLKSKRMRQHLAIAMWYDDSASLQKYVPALSLLHRFEGECLQVAYIDRYLLFTLFPETLAISRKFYLRIAPVPPDSIPSIKDFMVSLVTIPAGRTQLATSQHISALKRFYHDKTLHVEVGEVFSVDIDSGKAHYAYHTLEPQSKHTVVRGTIDGRSYKNCSVMVNQKQSYVADQVPPSSFFASPGFWSCLHPPGLEHLCDTLFSFLVPVLLPPEQRPSCSPSVLLSGPTGVGKGTVIKAVVRRCRMNLMELNCYEFSSEALGLSEQKLMSNLSTALMSSPVVVVLTHVHVLGRTQNGKEEPRVATAFETFMSDVSVFNKKGHYPVVIVGTTSQPQRVSPQIHACFLHHMEVPPPSEREREGLLTGLSSESHVAPDMDWPDIAKRTAGFVLGDFVTLFSRASRLAVQDVTNYCSQSKSVCCVEDLSVAGVVITQEHLQDALDLLHSSHSDAIGAPKIPNVEWDDVGGLLQAKREILDTIQLPLLHPELFTSGLRRSGVLLYGAPGTGKTLLAKAVATECALNFLSVKGPELINMYVGQSEENVREVFVRARSAAPCVIFFDELDSIAPNRGRSGDSGGVMDRVVSQLLAELDGLQRSEDVFVIGATNRPDLLDQALLRPGRFDRLVYLGVSEDVESKTKVLRAITRRFNLDPSVDMERLALQCPANVTGADLYSLCSDAALTALRKQIDELESKGLSDDDWQEELVVRVEDFLQPLSSLTPSVSPEELKRYSELGRNNGDC